MKIPHTGHGDNVCETDHGGKPFVANIVHAAKQNQNFRTAFWTGCHLQMTVMCIPIHGEIGVEMHPDTDQFIRVEEGQALVRMGNCKDKLDSMCQMQQGDAVFIPSGTWHNVFNTGSYALKLSSFYAPPKHPKGTIHHTKADAANKDYSG